MTTNKIESEKITQTLLSWQSWLREIKRDLRQVDMNLCDLDLSIARFLEGE